MSDKKPIATGVDRNYRTVMSASLEKVLGARPGELLNWAHTQEEALLIDRIVKRAVEEGVALGRLSPGADQATAKSIAMDIACVHLNGTPLDLFEFAFTSSSDSFWHDLRGIRTHLDRTTGKLLHDFRPHFAKR